MKAEKWAELRSEYEHQNTTVNDLAAKYGVAASTIYLHAREENWRRDKKTQKPTESDAKIQLSPERSQRIEHLVDRLLDKLETAIDELSLYIATDTVKTKVTEYDNAQRPDKATKETVREQEKVVTYESIIDRNGLKQVTATLKELKETFVSSPEEEAAAGEIIRVIMDEAKEYAR